MRILVVGSGAREHAIAHALAGEDAGHDVLVAPGNAGIAAEFATAAVDASDGAAVTALALAHGAELVVIGPEAPLIAGVADAVRARGIPVFGPDAAAARLEGSKAFAKRIMAAAGVPTAAATEVLDLDGLDAALDAAGAPYVVKADGLAAGKGVLVTASRADARSHALEWLARGPVLIESFLPGREVSLFFVSDGERVIALPPAQDFKRVGDGDTGPNTGGMGAYSPLPWLVEHFGSERAFAAAVHDQVAAPVVARLAAEGTPFVGLLYCGLAVDGAAVRVIEFNVRFGDPETQVVLPRLASPLSTLLAAAAAGDLRSVPEPMIRDGAAVGVVIASEGYPASTATGRPVLGLADAAGMRGLHIDHAATTWSGSEVLAAGGRVLTVVGVGVDVPTARATAYAGVDRIRLAGSHHRSDIAAGVQ